MEMIKRLLPEFHPIAMPSLLRAHDVKPNESIGMVVANPCNTSDRLPSETTCPNALTVCLAIDSNIPRARRETLTTFPVIDQRNIGLFDRANPESRIHLFRLN